MNVVLTRPVEASISESPMKPASSFALGEQMST